MADRNDKYGVPFSMRLSVEERARLAALAGDMTAAAYVRSRLFDTPSPRRRKIRRYDVDKSLLKKLVRELGRQHISSRLHRIMNAIDAGDLEMDGFLLETLCSTGWKLGGDTHWTLDAAKSRAAPRGTSTQLGVPECFARGC